MKRILRISLYILAGLVLLLATGGWYFSRQIKPVLIAALNEQLQVPVHVREIKLSSLSHFPRLGISFHDLRIDESQPYYDTALLEASQLDLYVNVFRMLRKEYVIDGVTLTHARLRLAHTSNGSNFDLFKPSEDEEEAVDFAIRKMVLNDCHITYAHQESDLLVQSHLEHSTARISYRPELTELSLRGQMRMDSLIQDKAVYMRQQSLQVNTEFRFTEDYSQLSIPPSDLLIGDVLLHTKGFVHIGEETHIDISFSNEEAPLNAVRSILPEDLAASMAHLTLDGSALIQGQLKGNMGPKHNPSFGFTYALKNGRIGVEGASFALEEVQSSGELKIPDMGDLTTAWVQCKLDNIRTGSHRMVGDLHIDNFVRPLIKWAGDAAMDAATLGALLNSPDLRIDAGDLLVNGKMEVRYDSQKGEVVPNSFHYLGTMRARGIKARLSDPDLEVKRADLEIKADESHVIIKQCAVQYDASSLDLKGYILHADQLFNTRSNTEITGKLRWNNLILNDFLSNDTTEGSQQEQLLPFKVTVQTEITDFSFNHFKASSITGTLYGKPLSFHIPDAHVKALDGDADADIKFSRIGENYLLDIASKVRQFNISQLFAQLDNFGQESLTSEHISGKLSGTIVTKLIFDPHFEPMTDKLYAKADIEIKDGQLIRYEPLKALSAFVQVKELENVQFSSLRNTVEIFNRTIFIPRMFIGNNALSIDLEGTHTFDNYMDYHLSVNLAELLASRTNWLSRHRENVEVRERGGLTAHVHMQGTPDDLQISYDKVAVREAIQDNIDQERETLRRIFTGQDVEEDVPQEYYEDLWDE